MFNGKEYRKETFLQLKKSGNVLFKASSFSLIVFTLIGIGEELLGLKNELSIIPFLLIAFSGGTVFLAFAKLSLKISTENEEVFFKDFVDFFSDFIRGFLSFIFVSFFIFLWSLLFFFPGAVKAVSYSQTFFVLADSPKIGPLKAIRISKVLTQGHKADLFLAELCFLIPQVLILLALYFLVQNFNFIVIKIFGCIVFLAFEAFLKPYQIMFFSNAYHALKSEGFRKGVLTPADFEN